MDRSSQGQNLTGPIKAGQAGRVVCTGQWVTNAVERQPKGYTSHEVTAARAGRTY